MAQCKPSCITCRAILRPRAAAAKEAKRIAVNPRLLPGEGGNPPWDEIVRGNYCVRREMSSPEREADQETRAFR